MCFNTRVASTRDYTVFKACTVKLGDSKQFNKLDSEPFCNDQFFILSQNHLVSFQCFGILAYDDFLKILQTFVLFLTGEAYSHSSLHTRELGQTPLC